MVPEHPAGYEIAETAAATSAIAISPHQRSNMRVGAWGNAVRDVASLIRASGCRSGATPDAKRPHRHLRGQITQGRGFIPTGL
jgi:hypothetical protein